MSIPEQETLPETSLRNAWLQSKMENIVLVYLILQSVYVLNGFVAFLIRYSFWKWSGCHDDNVQHSKDWRSRCLLE